MFFYYCFCLLLNIFQLSSLTWIIWLQLTWENNPSRNIAETSFPITPTAALMLFTLLSRPPHILSSHSEAASLSCLVTVSNTTVLPSLWQQMQPPIPALPSIDPRCVWLSPRRPWPLHLPPSSPLIELELCLNWHSHSLKGIAVVKLQYKQNLKKV